MALTEGHYSEPTSGRGVLPRPLCGFCSTGENWTCLSFILFWRGTLSATAVKSANIADSRISLFTTLEQACKIIHYLARIALPIHLQFHNRCSVRLPLFCYTLEACPTPAAILMLFLIVSGSNKSRGFASLVWSLSLWSGTWADGAWTLTESSRWESALWI